MILVTGATGFIGRALIRQLFATGRQVRVMIRPSRRTPRLPKGVPLEVSVVSLADERAIRAALKDVDVVFHLASAESQGRDANLPAVDMQGTENLARVAAETGVKRLVYLSHLGAGRSSGYPAFKAKGIAEEHIRRSGVPHTIFRSSLVFGPEDHFTTGIARLLRAAPGIFPLPGEGQIVIQPLWVEDLITVLLWSLDNPETINQTYEIGGSEYFSVRRVIEIIMEVHQARRLLVPFSPVMLRALAVTLESFVPNFPVSSFWLDYAAISRTCPVDNLPRLFGLMPARFTYRLDYLKRRLWYVTVWKAVSTQVGQAVDRFLESVRTMRLP
jgi:NADH dehydrogenase